MQILFDITIVLAISAGVLYFCLKLNIPTIVAFLIAGMLVGPHGFGLVSDVENVESLAEVGVLLLLFTIGMEFSIDKLIRSKRYIFIGGTLQLILTIGAFTCLSVWLAGMEWNRAIFAGALFSLSSTAIVLQLFQESNQIESLHGRVSLSILIFQDIAIVPLILILPWLAAEEFKTGDLVKLGSGIVLVAIILYTSRKFMPRLIEQIVRTRNRELFLLFIITICFLTAMLTRQVGLSLALGAFLAGLMISESEFSLEAMSSILPFKKVFTSIFFISIGMLLNLRYVFHQLLEAVGLVLLVLIVKILIILLVGWLMRMPKRSIIITALALCQVGEFAFVLSQQGAEHNLLDEHISQMFLAVSVITMGVSPFIIQVAPCLAERFTGMSRHSETKANYSKAEKGFQVNLTDHLIIIGFGTNGRNLSRAAREAGIPYVVIDYNPDTYRKEIKQHEYFIFGDAANTQTLERAAIQQARIAVVATHDPVSTEMIVSAIKKHYPKIIVIARTRFLEDMDRVRKLGADEVIPEEFETSIEIFTRVMKQYLVPDEEIARFSDEIRSENYKMLRNRKIKNDNALSLISQLGVTKLKVFPNSVWINKSLKEIHLRRDFGINVIAVQRGGQVIQNPAADFIVNESDILIALGFPTDFEKAAGFAVFT